MLNLLGFLPLSCLVLITLVSFATQAQDNSIVTEREPYSFSFNHYHQWLAFMDKAPDPAWRSASMSKLVDKATFERFRQQSTVKAERIVYQSDGLAIKGLIFSPTKAAKKYPVVLFAHGGVAQWGRITFFDVLEMHRLAERGYIVIASTLRGEGGSEGKPNLGRGDRNDMLNLLKVAAAMENADLENVGIWGFSRGGALGYRVLAASERFKAAVLIGAPSDSVNSARRQEFHKHVYPGIVDGYEADQDAALRALSAAFWPQEINRETAILLIHGANDVRVPVGSSLDMAAHFVRLNQPFRLIVPEQGSHALIEHQKQVRIELDRWFDKYLKDEDR